MSTFPHSAASPAQPIFILGVPRSGTTLLRTILDAHPKIASGPETPWLGGHQPRSLMALWGALRDEKWGYCKSFNMPREVPTEAARAFLSVLMDRYAAARGKARWAEKTPDNALHVEFLAELFPLARFVHLVRDGLDVAMSTSVVAAHRRGISEFLEQNLGFGPDVPPVANSPLTALLRWNHWNNLIRKSLSGLEHHTLGYERLVTEPEPTVRALMEFVGEDFDPAMLEYAGAKHDYPEWEWGSADVRTQAVISSSSVGRGGRELPPEQFKMLGPLCGRGDREIVPRSAPAGEAEGGAEVLARWIRGLAQPWGLDAPFDAAAVAWLWEAGLGGFGWCGKRVVVLGSRRGGQHPLPWILALLGARVSVPGSTPESASARLARGLRVEVTLGAGGSAVEGADAALVLDESAVAGDAIVATGAPVFVLGGGLARWSQDKRFAVPVGAANSGAAVLIRRE